MIARPAPPSAGARFSAPPPGVRGAPLALAGLLAGPGGVWALFSFVPSIHGKDAITLYEFTTLDSPRTEAPLKFLLHLLNPSLFILWGIALVAFAIAGERPRVALAVAPADPRAADAPSSSSRSWPTPRQRRLRDDQRCLLAERPCDGRDRAALAPCSSRRAACARSSPCSAAPSCWP